MPSLIRWALRRRGIFTLEDARRFRVSDSALSRACKNGTLQRVLPRTYLVGGTPWDWSARAEAATRWCGGALSHLSAAYLHGLIEEPSLPIEVSCPTRRSTPDKNIRLHLPTTLIDADVMIQRGFKVTSPARTLLDLGGRVADGTLELYLEEALRRGLVSLPRLRWQLQREGRSGRNGAAHLRTLLDLRKQEVPTESPLETRLAQWLRGSALPQPVRQHRVMDGTRFVARIDFAYPSPKVGIEATSFRWHSGRQGWVRDRQREGSLRALGWRIIYVVQEDLAHRSAQLEAEIAAALGLSLF